MFQGMNFKVLTKLSSALSVGLSRRIDLERHPLQEANAIIILYGDIADIILGYVN
jgi:hypothetical protein